MTQFPCSCKSPPDIEQFDEGCFLFELAFNFGNELFTAAVDVVLGVKKRTPSGIALSLNSFDAFLGVELFLKGQRGSCGAARFPDLPVEFLNFTLQTSLQIIGPPVQLVGFCFEEVRIPLGDGFQDGSLAKCGEGGQGFARWRSRQYMAISRRKPQ
jgi:hypothetical protein